MTIKSNEELHQQILNRVEAALPFPLTPSEFSSMTESLCKFIEKREADHDAQLEQDLLAEFAAKGAEKRFCEQIIKSVFHGTEE